MDLIQNYLLQKKYLFVSCEERPGIYTMLACFDNNEYSHGYEFLTIHSDTLFKKFNIGHFYFLKVLAKHKIVFSIRLSKSQEFCAYYVFDNKTECSKVIYLLIRLIDRGKGHYLGLSQQVFD